jgi:hypothetical protein
LTLPEQGYGLPAGFVRKLAMLFKPLLQMKKISILGLLALSLFVWSCGGDDDTTNLPGTFVVEFDNMIGSKQMSLSEAGSDNYPFTTGEGQPFNLTLFGYYVSKIKLEGPNGELYEDEIKVSANAADVKGYYQVLESDAASQFITLHNVPEGKYNKITFTVGIDEDGVQEGAAGGILDPAAGAWFWNWNAGYIGMAMEGTSPDSPQEEVQGDGWVIYAQSFAVHIGGWKDIAPAEGETQKFYNNVKTVTLEFDSPVTVSETLEPEAHIVMDLLKVLDGADIDFGSTYAVHSPAGGKVFADQLSKAFILDHIHQ